MRAYQEEYIANVKEVSRYTARRRPNGESFEEYLEEVVTDRERVERKVKRNMELLRDGLFPVLDHILDANEEDIGELFAFAEKLLNGREELDVGLFCLIHKALLNLARLKKDRSGIIRELYWQGIGYNNLCNKLVGLELTDSEKYVTRMRLCFTEAAACLKYFDEIEDSDTRGYILRSLANMSLGTFKSPSEKIRTVKRSLLILQDKEYQKKEPTLPWNRYIYMAHQQMAASISYSKESTMTPQDVECVMESVYIVYQNRLKEVEGKEELLPVRTRFSYYAIEYYCGLDHLNGLLTKLERLMDATDSADFSVESMYGMISLPAFYCQFLNQYPDRLQERKEYLERIYLKVKDYVEAFPESAENESLFFYLRQLSKTFIETERSIPYKDFLQMLQIRFAPEIYVHSWIVGTAAEEFCRIIMDENPSFFDDIDFIREIRDPAEKKRRVPQYAMECGMYHDVGKLNFMNLYSLTVRQWFEEEYEMAHMHTLVGESLLADRLSTRHYAEVAKGHHYWYDGSRGYPESYRRLNCQYRQMVDVIGLMDWLDNVTYTARLYKGVEKTFDEAVEAAIALEGRRFSPLLTAMLRDSVVAERLKAAFAKGHREAYRRLYEEYGKAKKRLPE